MIEYWRNKLDRKSDRCYAQILQGIRRQVKNIDCGDVSADDVKNAYIAICNDHPEMFYLSSTLQITQRKRGWAGGEMLIYSNSAEIEHIYSDEQIHDCELKIERIKAALRKDVNLQTTDEQKVLIAAEYLVRNTVYEVDDFYNQNAASALCFGKAQCSGFSRAFKLLMDAWGIYCIVINGDADNEQGHVMPHAWNIVRLGGNYYHVDVTFMFGANMNRNLPVNHIYLLYDDDEIAKDHSWDRTRTPKCTDKSKYINDFAKKSSLDRQCTKSDVDLWEHNHYSSFSQVRFEIREAIRARATCMAFCVDTKMSPQEIAHAVKNAFTMVAEKESIGCTFSVSVSGGSRVNIEIKY